MRALEGNCSIVNVRGASVLQSLAAAKGCVSQRVGAASSGRHRGHGAEAGGKAWTVQTSVSLHRLAETAGRRRHHGVQDEVDTVVRRVVQLKVVVDAVDNDNNAISC